jgi:hypothetical protein
MNSFFVDGHYAYTIAKKLSLNLDYLKLLNLVKDKYGIDRGYYYNTLISNEDDVTPLRNLTDFLQYNSYTVRYLSSANEAFKPASRAFVAASLIIDAVKMLKAGMNTAVFMVSTLEYINLFEYLKDAGVEVILLYSDSLSYSTQLRQTSDLSVPVETFIDRIRLVKND